MKSPKEDYKIRKSVASDPGTREDLLISSHLIHSLFIIYFYLEAINVRKKYINNKDLKFMLYSWITLIRIMIIVN